MSKILNCVTFLCDIINRKHTIASEYGIMTIYIRENIDDLMKNKHMLVLLWNLWEKTRKQKIKKDCCETSLILGYY
jgi:hypothetical protein